MQLNDLKETGMAETLKIAVLAPQAATLAHVRALLHEWDPGQRPAETLGGPELAGRVADQERPDVLLVESTRDGHEDLAMLERMTARHPRTEVVLLSADQSPQFLRLGMRAGLREILPVPVARDALLDTLGRVQQRRATGGDAARSGKILAFIGCKGGSGATFLATNLGYALAQNEDRKVALIDLNCQFGDAAFYVSQRTPGSNLSDVAQQIHRLDGALLASSMIAITPSFHLLPAPEEPDQALPIRAEHIDKLLWVAASHYDVVIVDAGRSLDALTVRAMDRADTVFAVLQLSLPYVRDAKRLLRALTALGYGAAKVRLLVNRYERDGELTLQDVAGALKHEIYRTLPNSYSAVASSINHGVPILQNSARDPVTRALAEMAGTLVERQPAVGWLRNLLPGRERAARA